jgi:PAS domain S-box-containing protein
VRARTAELTARTAELAASEARYRALVEAMASVVWRTDAAGLVEDMPEWRALTGQGGAEVRGWGWLDALHPEDRAPARAAWERAVADRAVYETEYRIRGRDGAWRWYAVRGVPVRDAGGAVREWVGVCIDIDERKRAEAELRESEERYRTLVDTSPDAVLVHQDGTVILANREAVALFGAADPALLVGRAMYDLVDPASLPLARARTERLREPGQRNGLAELGYRRLDGTPFPVEAASAAVLVGGRLAVQAAFRDVSARKAAEEHQRLLVQELAHRVKNTLAVVQGIAARSLVDGRTLDEARDVLTWRLRALAGAHTLLIDGGWQGASLKALAEATLAAYGRQVEVEGADVVLTPKAALTLGLVLHELATNALKHGALSVPAGRVAVGWEVAGPPGGASLSLIWRERGGPPVAAPTRHGFGRTLIEQAVAYELGGRARLDFEPQGVRYALEAALAA